MNKIYVILAIMTVGSAVFLFLPGVLEGASHLLHWLTLLVSSHHISEQLGHALHPHKDAVKA